MYNVILISTMHTEIGKCNSDELYKIIASINPEVVFEELPSNLFERLYNGDPVVGDPPEVRCIRKYLQSHDVKHIPVDIEYKPNPSNNNIEHIFNIFEKYEAYKTQHHEQYLLTKKHGFFYLNSEDYLQSFNDLKVNEENLLQSGVLNAGELNTYKLFYEEQNIRENKMIENIYNYSKQNYYNQGVFFLGAAHRNSITKKILQYEKLTDFNLNWTFYTCVL